jgi:hypothetical protein
MTILSYNPDVSYIAKSPRGIRVHPVMNVLLGHQGIDYSKAPSITSMLGLLITMATANKSWWSLLA